MVKDSEKNVSNILAVIDTRYIKNKYKRPSIRPKSPTLIDSQSQYLIRSTSADNLPNANLAFSAGCAGDKVSFRAISITGNSDDAVIIYGIHFVKGCEIFGEFICNLTNLANAVEPGDTMSGMPAITANMNFTSFDAETITDAGEGVYQIFFALYSPNAQGVQIPYGYFRWASIISLA